MWARVGSGDARADLACGVRGAALVAAERVDGGAEPREAACARQPETRRRSGDEHRCAVDPGRIGGPIRQGLSHQQSDPPVPEHDAPVERRVDRRLDQHSV